MRTTFLMLLSLAAVAVGCGDEPAPVDPGFAADVRPIFLSRCVRCHGAGGKLNGDPLSLKGAVPMKAYLDHYDDVGTCVAGAPPSPACMQGAKTNAALVKIYIHAPEGTPLHMPPAPAEPLSDRQIEIIDLWAAKNPPKP